MTRGSNDGGATYVKNIAFANIDTSVFGQVTYTVSAQVDTKNPASAANVLPNQVLAARILVNGAVQTTSNAVDFCVNGTPYSQVPDAVPGPFALSTNADALGNVSMTFVVSNVQQNDVVTLNVEAIARDSLQDDCQTGGPSFLNSVGPAPTGFSFPDTPKANRAITHVVP